MWIGTEVILYGGACVSNVDHSFCRKVEIVQFARQTRLLLIRLLALVKWAGNSGSVQQCSVSSRWSVSSGCAVTAFFHVSACVGAAAKPVLVVH